MKGIYCCAYKDRHKNYDIVYNDIEPLEGIDIVDDCKNVDLEDYDYIIATPPCNYWSRANYRRDISDYALKTKSLLPYFIKKCCYLKKPFIVENVRNDKLFLVAGLYDLPCFVYRVGRHTYWTNVFMPIFLFGNDNITNLSRGKRQGGMQVHTVIEYFLSYIHDMPEDSYEFISKSTSDS